VRQHATAVSAADAGSVRLGDLVVNRLGFGAMRITGRGVFGPPEDRAEAIRVLRRAVELDVTFIDTADSYGPFVSEELIAEALHPYPAGLVVATKAGYERSGPDEWEENGRPEHIRRACEGSLRRLRLERIDLYQLHRIDTKVPEDEQFGVMAELVREGKVRHVGLSEVDSTAIARAQRFLPIVSVQNRYNLADREWDATLGFCEQEGITFIPWYPLGAGRLDNERAVGRVAKRIGATPMQVAIAWLLQRSPVMLPIPGTSRVDHVEENIAAAELRLTPADIAEVER
jgi:aryl-alcohol dehydrogenase-like predicted oxidoreductase